MVHGLSIAPHPSDRSSLRMPTRSAAAIESIHHRCPICLDSFDGPLVTKCEHHFCESCIRMALEIKKECPTCRAPIASHRELRADAMLGTIVGSVSARATSRESITSASWTCGCTTQNLMAASRCITCSARRPATALRRRWQAALLPAFAGREAPERSFVSHPCRNQPVPPSPAPAAAAPTPTAAPCHDILAAEHTRDTVILDAVAVSPLSDEESDEVCDEKCDEECDEESDAESDDCPPAKTSRGRQVDDEPWECTSCGAGSCLEHASGTHGDGSTDEPCRAP